MFIQSTDKNLLVGVGGAIISSFNEKIANDVAKSYPGRASSSQTLDVFMTLLSLGKSGYMKLVKQRKENFIYLREKMDTLSKKHNEKVLIIKNNQISLAMTLDSLDKNNVTKIGSMLFTRGCSGCRVIATNDEVKSIGEYKFISFGNHKSINNNIPYLTAAAGIGISQEEVDSFIEKLDTVLMKFKNK